jgi:hypothetical protein
MADKMCDELPQNTSKPLLNFDKKWRSGGGSGIRTLGGLTPSPVFKTGAFDHSAKPPRRRAS